jgi:hypothetical protein
MKAGIILLIAGLLLIGLFYLKLKSSEKQLEGLKADDLVSYYIELVIELIPVPFWSGIVGIALSLCGIIVLLIHIPGSI